MAQLHELLAAEKTVNAAWKTLQAETLKKLGNEHFFSGVSKSLKMIEDSPQNEAIEQQYIENKMVPTTVACAPCCGSGAQARVASTVGIAMKSCRISASRASRPSNSSTGSSPVNGDRCCIA